MVAASGINARRKSVIPDKLLERNTEHLVAVLDGLHETIGLGLMGHLAVAERLRALDAVTHHPNLPEFVTVVTADVMEVLVSHFYWILWLRNPI